MHNPKAGITYNHCRFTILNRIHHLLLECFTKKYINANSHIETSYFLMPYTATVVISPQLHRKLSVVKQLCKLGNIIRQNSNVRYCPVLKLTSCTNWRKTKQNKTEKKKPSIISINSFETKMFLNTTNFLKKFSWKFSLKTYHASN